DSECIGRSYGDAAKARIDRFAQRRRSGNSVDRPQGAGGVRGVPKGRAVQCARLRVSESGEHENGEGPNHGRPPTVPAPAVMVVGVAAGVAPDPPCVAAYAPPAAAAAPAATTIAISFPCPAVFTAC